jgi:hypothetical protein
LRARGMNYTTARAADSFLDIIADFRPLPARTGRPLAVAGAL